MEREFDLLWAEEPAGRRDVVGLRTVSRSITAAVATGENLDSSADFASLIRFEAVDIIQIGALTSGITGALQVADMAYANGIPVAMMNCPGRHMAHVAAALPHHMMMEVLDCGRDQAFSHEALLVDGRIQLGNAPGSGISFSADQFERADEVEPSPSSLRAIYRKAPGTWVDESRSTGPE
jgi:L-alanine-DL-glutamate epimerase-like enolase superfamily enzyme